MQIVSKTTRPKFGFNKHLMIMDVIARVPRAIMANIFLVSHILLLFHLPKGS